VSRGGAVLERARRSGCDRLSRKERLVLAELARGNSTEEIGLVLEVSPHTVRTHVKNLMRKLGARTRAHAVAIALSERAIEIKP
jgi:DNA-binding CsgD family transcriptional regulator